VAEKAPDVIKLFTAMMMVAGAGVIGICYDLLNDFVLGSRLKQFIDAAKVPTHGHYIVCGLGAVGMAIVEQLQHQGHEVVVIEVDSENRFRAATRALGVPIIEEDARLEGTLKAANIGKAEIAANAETAPLEHPEYYQYDFALGEIAELWRRGSVVSSWLLDLTANALAKAPDLDSFSSAVADSGEGRWTVAAAIDEGTPAPVLSAALFQRFSSRGEDSFACKIVAAMRKEFGGH
jgi:6-phosphogluconate dehydrogenase (decarboxylating)